MTELLERREVLAETFAEPFEAPKTIEKVAIVISKGSLDGVYPGLILANGARMRGSRHTSSSRSSASTRSGRTASPS